MTSYSTTRPKNKKTPRPLWHDLSEQAQATYRGGLGSSSLTIQPTQSPNAGCPHGCADGDDYLIWTMVDEDVH